MSTGGKALGGPRVSSQEYDKEPEEETGRTLQKVRKKPKRVIPWKTNEIFNDQLCKMKIR